MVSCRFNLLSNASVNNKLTYWWPAHCSSTIYHRSAADSQKPAVNLQCIRSTFIVCN